MLKKTMALLLAMMCTAVTAETLYRWADDSGNPQFGQHPPANRPFTEVNIRASQPPGGQLRARQEPAPAVEENTPADAPAEPQAMSEEVRKQRCERARADAQTLENNPRLARTLPSGERERIGEDERQELIRQARADIERYCR
jgi:hypothetical protein